MEDRLMSLNDRINDLISAIENDECQYWTISKIISALKKLPNVTQVKAGHWKIVNTKHIYGDKGGESCYCSECGKQGAWTKFCPNCGVDMKEDKNGR